MFISIILYFCGCICDFNIFLFYIYLSKNLLNKLVPKHKNNIKIKQLPFTINVFCLGVYWYSKDPKLFQQWFCFLSWLLNNQRSASLSKLQLNMVVCSFCSLQHICCNRKESTRLWLAFFCIFLRKPQNIFVLWTNSLGLLYKHFKLLFPNYYYRKLSKVWRFLDRFWSFLVNRIPVLISNHIPNW